MKVLPKDVIPVDVMDTDIGWRMSEQLLLMKTAITRTGKAMFQEYIRSQEEHITQYYTQIEFLTGFKL
jgi:hypothetical protein